MEDKTIKSVLESWGFEVYLEEFEGMYWIL